MTKAKKYLEAENRWLWYNHLYADERADHIEVKQYDKKGELIAMSLIHLPPKRYRVKHPKED